MRASTWAIAFAAMAAGCGALRPSTPLGMTGAPPLAQDDTAHHTPSGTTPIAHIVLIVQENRTFNDLFATFPGAIGTTTGKMYVNGQEKSIALKKTNLLNLQTLRHTYYAYKTAYRSGDMDGFNLIRFATNGELEGSLPYQYVDPTQIRPYWTMASQYALADKMFQTQGSGSYPAHQDLIRGGTELSPKRSIVDDPTRTPWGCNSPPGTLTSVITTDLRYERDRGPYPCLSYKTLQALLDANSVSWKYYAPTWKFGTGGMWNAFLSISAVYKNHAEWNAHISKPETNILTDISNGALPAMSWVIPDGANSDHSGYAKDTGPSWVASVVNAVGESRYWKSTAIVIVWDDWGGYYDPIKPPKLDHQGGPGFRVPMIVVSPYVPVGEISNTVYEFGSVIRFIEDNWNLGRLGTTDETTKSIADIFNFNQSPRKFKKIPARYPRNYFLHQAPSNIPVDTE